jgi:hypothetical protein
MQPNFKAQDVDPNCIQAGTMQWFVVFQFQMLAHFLFKQEWNHIQSSHALQLGSRVNIQV